MTQETIAKLGDVLANEEIAKKITATETPEAAIAILAENGVEITVDELMEVIDSIKGSAATGELNEEALEGVAGGVSILFNPVLSTIVRRQIQMWGIAIAEKLLGRDLNGNGKVGK